MTSIVFYEKPGCANNTRQKAMLIAAGYEVDARDLLKHRWTTEALRPFFGDKPVAAWFNRAAPRVKSGEVVPEEMDEAAALAAMLSDPFLIRRPLIQSGEQRMAGFDADVEQLLGLLRHGDDVETCVSAAPCRSVE